MGFFAVHRWTAPTSPPVAGQLAAAGGSVRADRRPRDRQRDAGPDRGREGRDRRARERPGRARRRRAAATAPTRSRTCPRTRTRASSFNAAGYDRLVRPVTVAAGQTAVADVALRRNWSSVSGGATATGDAPFGNIGCGPTAALDQNPGTGWSTSNFAGTNDDGRDAPAARQRRAVRDQSERDVRGRQAVSRGNRSDRDVDDIGGGPVDNGGDADAGGWPPRQADGDHARRGRRQRGPRAGEGALQPGQRTVPRPDRVRRLREPRPDARARRPCRRPRRRRPRCP